MKRLLVLVLCFCAQLLNACVVVRPAVPTISPMQQRLNAGLITARDLPRGWGHRMLFIKDVDGVTERMVVYYGDDPDRYSIVVMSQTLFIYSDEEASTAAFGDLADQVIPPTHANEYTWPEELEFENHADEMVIGCTPGVVNGIPHWSCGCLARYDDMVVRVYSQVFEKRWMTMSQFRQVLERVDARMEAAKAP